MYFRVTNAYLNTDVLVEAKTSRSALTKASKLTEYGKNQFLPPKRMTSEEFHGAVRALDERAHVRTHKRLLARKRGCFFFP